MRIPKMFVMKRTALDGKIWWCVCYKDLKDEIQVWSKKKSKKRLNPLLISILCIGN